MRHRIRITSHRHEYELRDGLTRCRCDLNDTLLGLGAAECRDQAIGEAVEILLCD